MTKQVIMMSEPFDNVTPNDVREWLKEENYSERSLAVALACANNKFWWIEDDLYDYEEDSKEYEEIWEIVDSWEKLMKDVQKKIYGVLRKKRIYVPKKKQGSLRSLIPFMSRNGYYDGGGWWIEKDN